MLVMSREVGQSIVIEDVRFTLDCINEESIEFSLVKLAGGKPLRATLPFHEWVEICCDVQVVLVSSLETKARFGFEGPRDVKITRSES